MVTAHPVPHNKGEPRGGGRAEAQSGRPRMGGSYAAALIE
jgi:hypothetical protein